jgi:hypothetical protein
LIRLNAPPDTQTSVSASTAPDGAEDLERELRTVPQQQQQQLQQLRHIRAERTRPVVLWGSHHKTGTYLAQKMFSVICAKMQWCCLFLVTRDSINSVKDWMTLENTDVVGHSQVLLDCEMKCVGCRDS